MKLHRRSLLKRLGFAPLAMLPVCNSTPPKEPDPQPTIAQNVTVNAQCSLIHQSRIQDVIIEAIEQARRRGRLVI